MKRATEILTRSELNGVMERTGWMEGDVDQRSPIEIVAALSGWELGSESWARGYIRLYEKLSAKEETTG